ncbi:hypothetical protein ACO1O0_003262 [Amphichorda felina]
MSWELPLLTTLILSVLGFCWVRASSPRLSFYTALVALLSVAPFLADPRRLVHAIRSASSAVLHDLRPDVLLATHFRMVLTLGAVVWLLHRSWQTVWKPVPELINILGVDVPEAPDVSLAGIRADAATLSWTQPAPNRPVQKYLIQVNGIHVTGLKPNHFYNIRVVAMGPNNFQAASQTVRLRTFGKDGKPYLGNARLPANFVDDDQSRPRGADDSNGSGAAMCSFAAVEAAPVLDGNPASTRDTGGSGSGQRRNTINRRHSPSVASADQPPIRQADSDDPEQSLDELNRQFQEIRKETNDTVTQMASDEAEFQQAEDELKKEKDVKRQSLKEKEEQTAGLKSQVRTTMESMRAAEKERSKKEQQLKDKETKKSKVRDSISKLEKDMERMKKERQGFQAQKASLEGNRDSELDHLSSKISQLQEEHNQLEADLSNKGKQLNEMKEARKHLAGADDEQVRESDERTRRDWENLRSSLHHQLVEETKTSHHLDQQYHALAEQISLQHQSGMGFYNQQEASPVDMESGPSAPPKRSSHASNEARLSPLDQFAMSDSPSQLPPGLTRPGAGFAPMLFMPDSGNDPPTEEELKSAGGPLSPSAQAYLPSGIIDNESDTKTPQTPMLPESLTAGEDDPQSPTSSSRSFSVLSSPHSSSFNLPFPQYQDNSDRGSLNINPAPAVSQLGGLRLGSLLSGFQRSRTAKPADEQGPVFGSLKPGQSQSFPRGTDEDDITGARRRMSFSLKSHRNSTGLDGGSAQPLGGSRMLTRRLNPFASSGGFFSERDPDPSRPPSIASSDLPRPSTDSGSIWGAPGDSSALSKSRFWSPSGEGRWASRSGSRRPSIHGSPSALTTSLASADDEILYETELNDPQTLPSQVGVIGSRPPGASKSLAQRLNPSAPTFIGLFRKDKDAPSERDKGKGKGKDPKGKGREGSLDLPFSPDDSPSDSRMSRDTFSLHTQTSVSESHDSLSLDASSSNTPIDLTTSLTSNPREAENVNGIRKLLRKGSSGKFSLSSRLGKDSSLFKKGPGSATNSDKNFSAEHRSSIGDLEELGEDPSQFGRSYDSVASSPSLGPAKSKESKEGRMTNWRFMKKKGKDTPSKEKESLEMDRAPDE